jgi:hypothetical protein
VPKLARSKCLAVWSGVAAWRPGAAVGAERDAVEPRFLCVDLLRFFGDKSGAKVIGVDLQADSVCTCCGERLVNQGVADLLEVIKELGNAACS